MRPLLAPPDYAAVYEALMNHDTVLKPAADGGVVLMASRQRWPAFEQLAVEHIAPWCGAGQLLPICETISH